LAEAALHQKTSESFFVGFVRRREFDLPEIGAWFENVDGVEEAFGLAIDFRDDAGACGSDVVAVERALERNFLAREKLFFDAQNAAVTADEERLSDEATNDAGGIHPGGFEGDTERDAIALTKGFCARGGHERGESTA